MARNNSNKAQQWTEVIDHPTGIQGTGQMGINRRAVKRMQDAAVDVQEHGGSYLYIFEDGSSLYEKRRDDWYPAGNYVQCPSCEEWREGDETMDCDGCAQAEADDEQATAILKSEVSN